MWKRSPRVVESVNLVAGCRASGTVSTVNDEALYHRVVLALVTRAEGLSKGLNLCHVFGPDCS